MGRRFFERLALACAADMAFLAAFGGGLELFFFACCAGLWAGLGEPER